MFTVEIGAVKLSSRSTKPPNFAEPFVLKRGVALSILLPNRAAARASRSPLGTINSLEKSFISVFDLIFSSCTSVPYLCHFGRSPYLERSAAKKSSSALTVVSTDFESRFDILDRGFFVSLMDSPGLPAEFIGLSILLYVRAEAAVRTRDFHISLFHLMNCVKQGYALNDSMYSLTTASLLLCLE
ncbi:hypothetical protein LAZ67_5002622 [Cordylochernes scorpioides]|uniref:Uncharacterized protein n=1 Tax=Cordylochernes scorpioides TaxID=51811 RepID=A0ABY6KH90_9ARAC|nr:hypothetical protein LAZ67_5002622 [Cordylochernes scorpioides]